MTVNNPNPLARSEVNEIIRWSFPIKKKHKGPSRPVTRAMLDTLRDASIQMEYARETPQLLEAGVLRVKDSLNYFREVGNSFEQDEV
jgi:hypothetical protein